MKTGYSVGDVMTKKPISVSPDETIKKIAMTMDDNHVGTVIIKDNDKVIGILTEQDIVRKIVAKGKNPEKEPVKNDMAKDLFTIEPEKDIFDALSIMRDENIRHLPVVSEGKIIGLITLKDILKIQPTLFDLLVDKFELREEEEKPLQ